MILSLIAINIGSLVILIAICRFIFIQIISFEESSRKTNLELKKLKEIIDSKLKSFNKIKSNVEKHLNESGKFYNEIVIKSKQTEYNQYKK